MGQDATDEQLDAETYYEEVGITPWRRPISAGDAKGVGPELCELLRTP
jgi:hypothetical protein